MYCMACGGQARPTTRNALIIIIVCRSGPISNPSPTEPADVVETKRAREDTHPAIELWLVVGPLRLEIEQMTPNRTGARQTRPDSSREQNGRAGRRTNKTLPQAESLNSRPSDWSAESQQCKTGNWNLGEGSGKPKSGAPSLQSSSASRWSDDLASELQPEQLPDMR